MLDVRKQYVMSVPEYLCVEYLCVRFFSFFFGGGGVLCVGIDSGVGCKKAIRHGGS